MKKIYLTILFALVASVGMSWATPNSITINESSHGSVVASSSSAAAGETITLTATPDDGYQLKSISGVYAAQATSSETLNSVNAQTTVTGTKFQCVGTIGANNYGWRVFNNGTADSTLTVSSKDGTTLITKIEFTSTWGKSRTNNMLSVSAGTLSFNGSPATTVTINDINATSVTISGSGINAGQTWCIKSVKVYYTATIENELEISDTENANVKTFTMVDSDVTISAEFEPAPTPADVYTVAGSSTAVFGTAWDKANTDNDMVLNAGVYTFTKENVLLAAGTIELKVVVNHSWDEAYPATNYQLSIPEGGNYNITVTYNPEGNVVAAVASLITPVVVLPTVSIAGGFNLWNTTANVLVESLDHLTCSGTISLTPGWYEFKVVSDGSWLSDGPAEGGEGDLYQMSRRYYSKLGLTTGRKNLLLLADVAGDYEFVYTYATHDLVISAPDFVREAANTNYQSLCTPFDATIEGATAYEFAGVSASGVSINQVTNLIAGHSYIIKPTAVGDININYVADGDVTLNAVQPNGTGLYGHLGDSWTYDYEAQTTWRNNYVLLDDDMFHEIQGGTVTFNHTRAYLHVESGEPAPALRIIETGHEHREHRGQRDCS